MSANVIKYTVDGHQHRDFWCNTCCDWTAVYVDVEPYPDMEPGPPFCNRCGEVFQCGECGYEIDLQGNCQRPPAEDGTRCPESEIER